MPLLLAQPAGSTDQRLRNPGQSLGEGAAWAEWGRTAKPPHLDPQRHRQPLAGQITERAFVPAVHMGGRRFTTGTSGRCLVQAGDDDEVIGRRQDLLDEQPCRKNRHEVRRQEPML